MSYDPSWIATTGTVVLMVVLSALGIYLTLVLFTRLSGLRSFSKMSSFDFAITVAFGSLMASAVVLKDVSLLRAMVALATLYLIQYLASIARQRSSFLSNLMDNDPLLLMAGPEVIHDNLKSARMTEGDLRSKLREANVIDRSEVRAVVLEATGDVSVLHADDEGADLDASLLKGVRGVDRLRDKENVQQD